MKDYPVWPFPDGPLICPFCGDPTDVRTIPTIWSGSLSSKGGGKSSVTMVKKRFCSKCYQRYSEKQDAEFREGKCYDIKELIDALKEGREPKTEKELHPEEYPKVDRKGDTE